MTEPPMPRRRKSATPHSPHDARARVHAYMLQEGGGDQAIGDFEELRGLLGDPRIEGAGQAPTPVAVSGPMIGSSALARVWYRFVETTHGRLVRGRAYLRAGAVLDLQVHRGIVTAEVQGTRRYHVKIAVALPGGLQLAELRARLGAATTLRGAALHDVILGAAQALLPAPRHIVPFCQCLDAAPFCKHVCAALYGLGVRLDAEPELLLVLRGLAPDEPGATDRAAITPLAPEKLLDGDLGALFGIDLLAAPVAVPPTPAPRPSTADPTDASSTTSPTASPMTPTDAPTDPTDASPTRSPLASPLASPPPADEDPDPPRREPELVLDAAPECFADPGLSGAPDEVRRDYLRELGIPPPTIDAWLREGVLRRTGRHGVYERTPEAGRRIAAHLGL